MFSPLTLPHIIEFKVIGWVGARLVDALHLLRDRSRLGWTFQEGQVRKELETITENLTSGDAARMRKELKKWVGEVVVQDASHGELRLARSRESDSIGNVDLRTTLS